jgi:hypothetical protein
MGRPLRRENGHVVYIVVNFRTESLRTHNRTSLSHLKLAQLYSLAPSSVPVASYNSQRSGVRNPPPEVKNLDMGPK